MLKRWTWLILILVALTALWGCSSDDDPVAPEKTAFEVVAEAGSAYINGPDCPGVVSADAVKAALDADPNAYTVIDIRSESVFLAGHIPGAYHSSLGTLLADLSSKSIPLVEPFLVVCYSGQSAGHAKVALEMLGYEAYSLGFGMASWFEDGRGSWDNNVANELAVGFETTGNNGALVAGDFPTLSEDAGTALTQRVAAMLAGGFKGVNAADVIANPGSYFIVNYFGSDDYAGTGTAGVPGHIPGAYQFTPKASLGIEQMLNTLPTDGTPIVTYCWTGQHSSQVTAYLNMLGYNAFSLKFGSNRLFHDTLSAHVWDINQHRSYATELGSTPTPAFAAIAEAGKAYVNSTSCPGVVTAANVKAALDADPDYYTILDIRGATAYDAAHIAGAINTSLGNLMSDLGNGTIPTDKPFLVACYSGQSAGHVKIALEMLGYEASSLKWGMSSWSSLTRAPWDNATVNNTVAGRNQLEVPETGTGNNDTLAPYGFPEVAGDAAGAVEAAVTGMLVGGFKGITLDQVEALEEVFVINYFGEADYAGSGGAGVPGHVPGAFQFTPRASMGWDEMLPYVPAEMPVVVYCWTGQTSSQITAYLNMLGYDAYSLLYGSNKLFYDDLSAHNWTTDEYNDFPVVTPGT